MGKSAKDLIDLPGVLLKLGLTAAESLVKWEGHLGLQSAQEAISTLLSTTKQDWENPAAYRARMEAASMCRAQMQEYDKAFNAAHHHLGESEMMGYITAEALQFVFGAEVLKGGGKGVKLEGKGIRAIQEVKEGAKVLGKGESLKLLGPAGDAAARFVHRMPKGWLMKPAKKGIGTRYVNPKNTGNYIRFSAENRGPRAALGQRVPYFERWKDGKCLTKEGIWVNPKTITEVEYHIPQTMFEELSHLPL
jgi:hypothetical protein